MMKIVLDTNIIVMMLTTRSSYHFLYQKLIIGDYTLLVSTDILLEYPLLVQASACTLVSEASASHSVKCLLLVQADA